MLYFQSLNKKFIYLFKENYNYIYWNKFTPAAVMAAAYTLLLIFE